MVYTKRVWFSNGIHHHYSSAKIIPDFSKEYFAQLVKNSDSSKFPLAEGETTEQLISDLTPIIFDPNIDGKKVNLNMDDDLIKTSAVNFYERELLKKRLKPFIQRWRRKKIRIQSGTG